MPKKIWLIPAFFLLALVALSLSQLHRQDSDTHIFVSGNIEVTQVESSFKLPGRIVARLVDEGDIVEKGQLIALLDDSELIEELNRQAAEVRRSEAHLLELVNGYLPEEIAQAAARYESSTSQLNKIQQDFIRQEQLYQQEVISQREFDAAKASYEVAIAQQVEAEEALTYLKNGIRMERIEQARAQLAAAEQAFALAKTRLDDSMLFSPLDGVVLSKNREVGEYGNAGTPVVTLADLHSVWLRAYINETELGRVKLGQTVHVTNDSYPDKIYTGKVVFISSEAEFTPKNVQTQKERVKLVYRIKVDLANPTMELKPGMPADGEIIQS